MAVVVAVLSIAAPARAEDWKYPEGRIRIFTARYSLFLRFTLFRPSSNATRDRYGSELRSQSLFGLFPFKILLFRPRNQRSGPEFDIDLVRRAVREEGERARFLAPTAGVKWRGDSRRSLIPSGALRAGAYFVRTDGVEGVETHPGLNAALGMEISRTAMLSVRYDWVVGQARTDLSGWTFDVAFKVF